MRSFWLLVVGCSISASALGALYKHVDEAGTVTYSDRPRWPHQEALQLPPPNVATPEARRQLELARQAFEREEQAEYEARIRRWAAVQRSTPVAYSRQLTPYAPGYALPVYYAGYARITSQSYTPQGLHPAGVSHRASRARR